MSWLLRCVQLLISEGRLTNLYAVLLLFIGLILLYFGAEWLIRGSSALALRMGLSPLIIGLTIVGFGTSSPELLVSVRAAMAGSPDIALGNVIGSNICNIALILGLSSLIRPLSINRQLVQLDVPVMIGCSILLIIFLVDAELTRMEGGILFLGILVYVGYSLYTAFREKTQGAEPEGEKAAARAIVLFSVLLVIVGLCLLIFGARLFVDGAIDLAESMGVSKAVIGLTIVALGTSLPELATSVVASIKNEGDISAGNIIGSNIFNILCILGVTAIVHPLSSQSISIIDVSVMTGIAVLTYPFLRSKMKLARAEGLAFLVIYVVYTVYLF